MNKFKVKIYDSSVSEHIIVGFEAAVDFSKNSKGHKAEIISEEGLVVLNVIPENVATAPVTLPVVESKLVVEEPTDKVEETKPIAEIDSVIESKPVIKEPTNKVEETTPIAEIDLVTESKPVIEEPTDKAEEQLDKVGETAPVINVFVDPDAINAEEGKESPVINIIVDSSEDIKSSLSKGIYGDKTSNVKSTTVKPVNSRKRYGK